jgi:membrane protease subunit (stomatin/prohibitin family)
MRLFSSSKEGGIKDAIRCDEKGFLIWKWRPDRNLSAGSSRKENSIRSGSSLNVRPGQAAVFLYPRKDGEYDVIPGPFNDVIKTDNMPVLASLVGALYAGGSPFQAEVYYINQEKGMEIPFYVDFFRVVPFEKEYMPYDIQVSVKGTLSFEVSTQPEYIKYMLEAWGGNDTTLEEFEDKVRALLQQEVKQIVANAPKDTGIFILHFNQLIGQIGPYVLSRIADKIAHRFGVIATGVNLSEIRYKENDGYQRLHRITEDQSYLFNIENEKLELDKYVAARAAIRTDSEFRIRNAEMMLEHNADMMARMREEGQYAQHRQTDEAARQARLGSESAFINAHSLNVQAEVMKTGLENMGGMGAMNLSGGEGHMNPAGMMTGMMMGASVAGSMGQMMNQMGGMLQNNMASAGQPQQAPPPIPGAAAKAYYIVVAGNQAGPCGRETLQQMAMAGQINADTLAWCEGMAAWTPMKQIPELAVLFGTPGVTPPPIPPVPPTL